MSKSDIYLLKLIVVQFFLSSLILAMQTVYLSDLIWEKRIIIILDDENFKFNNRVKKYQEQFKERDISVIFYNKGIAYLDNKIISDDFLNQLKRK